jgi:DUF1680 family protein
MELIIEISFDRSNKSQSFSNGGNMSRTPLLSRCILSLCAIGGLAVFQSFSAPVQPVVAAPDSFVGADFGAQPFAGYLGKRMEINLKKTLLTARDADSYFVTDLLAPYKDRANGGGTDGNWGPGEYLGKYIWAAVYAWKFSGDATMKARLDSAVNGVIQYQGSDGYWGCASAANRWDKGEGWDVWGCKYELDGMLADYIETGDTRVRDACVKFGDLMCNTFGPGKLITNIDVAGWWGGLGATAILESMASLYRYTGYQRYLDFCNYLLGTQSVSGIKTMCDAPTKDVFGKAYEETVVFNGLLEMYRINGDAALLQDAVNMAANVVSKHQQVVSGQTNGDQMGGVPSPTEGVELCDCWAWLQMNWHLFQITGLPVYAQNMEQTIYNVLLGGQNPRNGSTCWIIVINGQRGWGNGTGGAVANGCCGHSAVCAMASFPKFCMAGALGGKPAIVNYFNATFTINQTKPEARTLTVTMTTNYPANGIVTLAVNASSAGTYPILLRVPEWCASFIAKTQDGQQYTGTKGQFLSIQRAWGTNETIQVTMDMTSTVVSDPNPSSTLKAIKRGPQFLSLDPTVTGATLPAGWWGGQVYACQVNQGGQKTLYMVPYADASQTGSASSVLLPSFTLLGTAVVPAHLTERMSNPLRQMIANHLLTIDGRIVHDNGGPASIRAAGVYIDRIDNGISKVSRRTAIAR